MKRSRTHEHKTMIMTSSIYTYMRFISGNAYPQNDSFFEINGYGTISRWSLSGTWYFGHDFFVKKNNEPDSEYFFVIPITFDWVSLQIYKVQ